MWKSSRLSVGKKGDKRRKLGKVVGKDKKEKGDKIREMWKGSRLRLGKEWR